MLKRIIVQTFYKIINRGGYDEIHVRFNDPRTVSELQKTANILYGFEIFDITEKSYVIKSVYDEEIGNISAYTRKIIHTIKTVQAIIMEDIKNKNFE